MAKSTFRESFCRRFGCAPAEFEERAFRRCLYPHALPLALILRRVFPDFFHEDFKFIGYLGESAGVRDATVDVKNFNDVNRGHHSLLRIGCRIRVSGRRALRLVQEVLAETRGAELPAERDQRQRHGGA